MFPEDKRQIIHSITSEWYKSIRLPHEYQQRVLRELTRGYAQTDYGKRHRATHIENVEDYRTNFPIIDYAGLSPYIQKVLHGNSHAILPEPLVCWVMTRGSTGRAKVFPLTKTHLHNVFTCGARAVSNYILKTGDFQLLTGFVLNLNFPSQVHKLSIQGKMMNYGYSSGSYARLKPMLGGMRLLPRQEEIDALGSGITKRDWKARFELTYRQAINKNVTTTMGVTPVILSFARYVKKTHRKMPRDLWNFHALFCTSVRKIPFKYAPILRRYFGQVPVVEIYSATEGVFAQQLDNLPYVTPNYDRYFFEVETSQGVKMLHELRRGEWGKLIISSSILPRYNIGDLIEAADNNYFRVIGRHNVLTLLEHRLFRLFFKWFL